MLYFSKLDLPIKRTKGIKRKEMEIFKQDFSPSTLAKIRERGLGLVLGRVVVKLASQYTVLCSVSGRQEASKKM